MMNWVTRTAKDLYHSLGLWCCLGPVLSLCMLGILFLGWWLFVFPSWERLFAWYGAVVLLTPLFAGAAAQAFRTVREEETDLTLWMMDTGKLAWQSMQLMATWLFVAIVLLANGWFYWRFGSSPGRLLGLFSGSLLVMWLWASLYLLPVLNEHASGLYAYREKKGTVWVLYRSFLLMLSAPTFTLGAVGILLLWTVLNILIPIGLLTVWLPGILLFMAHMEKELLRKATSPGG
jgi:hypothetical protein